MNWPRKALIVAVACVLISAAVYLVAEASFSGQTRPGTVGVQSLDPVLLVGQTPDTTTFDVPDVTGAYPVAKCMPVQYTGPDTPVSVRVWGAPAGALDPQLVVTVEMGTSADEYNCAAFQTETLAYDGRWDALYGAHTDFASGVPAGAIRADGLRHAARVTFDLADPLNPPASGVGSRIVLSFGARPCTAVQCPLYLKTSGAPGAAATSSQNLPLTVTPPSFTGTVPNYDTNRNPDPGLTIKKGANGLGEWGDTTKFQVWATPALTAPLTFPSSAQVQLWSAMKSYKDQRGAVSVGLYSCSATIDATCTLLGSATVTEAKWHAKQKVFVQKTWVIPAPIATVATGRRLAVKVVVENDAQADMWFAYDTNDYVVQLQP